MRVALLLLVNLCALCSAAQHDHRASHQAAATRLELADDPNTRTLTARIGPLDLPAYSDHTHVAQPPQLYLVVPFEGWLKAYHPRMTDAAGATLPGRVVHHVAFWNTARSDFLCPNKLEHIFGAGGEMNDWPALPGYGYHVRKGDRILVTGMFHNPTQTSYPSAWLEVKIEYQLAGEGQALKSVYPAWFDVNGCGDSSYDLPAGASVRTGGVEMRHTGLLLGVGGHMHDYARDLLLENKTRKEAIAHLPPELDANGRIAAMPIRIFLDHGGYRLNRGETVMVTAKYDNPAGPIPEGAMAIVVGYFLPDDQAGMAALQRASRK